MIRLPQNKLDLLQLSIEGAALLMLAVVSGVLFAPVDALSVTIALATAYAVPQLVYRSRNWCTPTGKLVLSGVSLLMVALAVYSIWRSTVALDLPLSHPHLFSDAAAYYNWSLNRYIGISPQSQVAFPGFPFIMLVMFKLLGPSIVWPLAMNLMFTLLTIVVIAATTVRLLAARVPQSRQWLATAAICFMVTLMYFLSQGLRIQKEAMLYLAISLAGYVLAGMNGTDGQVRWLSRKDWAIWAVACVMMMLGRTTYLYFAALGLGLVALAHWRSNWRNAVVMGAIVAVAFVVGNMFARYSIDGHMQIVGGGYYMQTGFLKRGTETQPYLDLVGRYFYYPIWHRLALLPLTCSVQFIIPFPWLYTTPTVLELFPRLAWGWYAVGGTALYYYFFMSWRRQLGLGAWGWWPAIMFVLIAYVFAGRVSRYILPVEPLTVSLAVYITALLRQGRLRKSFTTWAVCFVIVLAATLVVCHSIQIDYLNSVDEYYRAVMGQ